MSCSWESKSLDFLKNWLFIVWLLSFESSSYILGNSPLLAMHFVNIFSQSVACFLFLLTVFNEEQKIFYLHEDHYQLFSLGPCLCKQSEKSSPNSWSPDFLHVVFLGFYSFILYLSSRFIFSSFLWRVKDLCLYSCSIVLPMLLSQRSPESVDGASLGDLYSVSLIYLSILLPLPQRIDCGSFVVSLKLVLSSLFFSGRIVFTIWVFASEYKLENPFVSIYKITSWNFDWNYAESIDQLKINGSIHAHGVCLHLFSSFISFIRVLCFPHIDLVHIFVIFICKYFTLGGNNGNGIFKKFSNSAVHCWHIGKWLTFAYESWILQHSNYHFLAPGKFLLCSVWLPTYGIF